MVVRSPNPRRIEADVIVDLFKRDGAKTNAEHWAPPCHEKVRQLQQQHQLKLRVNCSLLQGQWTVQPLRELGLRFMNFQLMPLACRNDASKFQHGVTVDHFLFW